LIVGNPKGTLGMKRKVSAKIKLKTGKRAGLVVWHR